MSCQGNLIEWWRDVLHQNILGIYELHFFGAKFVKNIHFFRPEIKVFEFYFYSDIS